MGVLVEGEGEDVDVDVDVDAGVSVCVCGCGCGCVCDVKSVCCLLRVRHMPAAQRVLSGDDGVCVRALGQALVTAKMRENQSAGSVHCAERPGDLDREREGARPGPVEPCD